MSGDFTLEQKRYLEGFMSGAQALRARPVASPAPSPVFSGPDAASHAAMARTEAQGKALCPEEKAKREELGLDSYDRMKAHAAEGVFPKGPDVLRWKYHGLFYVAPAQDSFMCRLRMPNGILTHTQMRGLADIAQAQGGSFCDITTRANLQIRDIPASEGVTLLEKLVDLGLTAKGSGADNIRNVTGTPTAGIDRQELLDTRPFAKAWHHYILNTRDMYGLPRKFNVAFDGAGTIGALEDTNDIGFQAVRLLEGFGLPAGLYFRLTLGGITGHKDFAHDTGIVLKPEDATRVAAAIVRVFIETGDRTDRKKARLKYVLDAMGFDAFLSRVETKAGGALLRCPPEAVAPRPEPDRLAHLGVHPQRQEGRNWIGIAVPLGRLTAAQMRGLADLAALHGDGDLRLTVWQNVLLSGIADAEVDTVCAAIATLGLGTAPDPLVAGLVACTGSKGCRFGNADTKGTARAILAACAGHLALDQPVNIHVTGCHNSCAQHYIGDLGLIGARIPVNDDGDTIDGFHLLAGGGFGRSAAIAQELYRDVPAQEAPALILRLLRTYGAHRLPGESVSDFTRRLPPELLKSLIAAESPA